MIAVRVVAPFRHKGEVIPSGKVMVISPEALPRLSELGLVEVIDVHRLIGEMLRELDAAGRPWPKDYYATLPTAALERLKQLMQEVEAAALADDINATAERLAAYRAELLRHLH